MTLLRRSPAAHAPWPLVPVRPPAIGEHGNAARRGISTLHAARGRGDIVALDTGICTFQTMYDPGGEDVVTE